MVFENLTVKLFPGETIETHRNPAVLTDAMKATVVDFYCSDIVSVISPSMKDKDIIRYEREWKVRDETGDTMKLQRAT